MARMLIGNVKGPAGIGVPSGGTTGQMLKKASATDFDTSWDTLYASAIPMTSSDSTKVDTAITSANQAIAKVNASESVTLNGEAAIKSYLETVASGMQAGESRLLRIISSDSSCSTMEMGVPYEGYLLKQYDNGTLVQLAWIAYNGKGKDVNFSKNGSTWTVYSLNNNKPNYFSVSSSFGIVGSLASAGNYYTIPENGWYIISYASNDGIVSLNGVNTFTGAAGSRNFVPLKYGDVLRYVSGGVTYVLH